MKEITIYTLNYCPYCHKAVTTLQEQGIEFKNIDATQNEDEISRALKEKYKIYGEVTYPQIIVEGKRIGGNDDLQQTLQNGTFDKIFR